MRIERIIYFLTFLFIIIQILLSADNDSLVGVAIYTVLGLSLCINLSVFLNKKL